MNVEIITVGTELLVGNILNTNAKYLAEELTNLGFNISKHTTVGDNSANLEIAFKYALSKNDLVILTGGLGPTKDDLTKETIAHSLSKNLIEDEKAKEKTISYFKSTKNEIAKNNFKQSLVIEDSTIFYNDNGTAPGMALKHNNKHILLLPGPPNELMPMFEKDVKIYLSKLKDQIIISKDVYLFGIEESKADQTLSDILPNTNPYIGIYAKTGEIKIRVTAHAPQNSTCETLINNVVDIIKTRLGEFIYGIDIKNMQNALVKTAIKSNQKIAVAESCTGGLIASQIVSISGSSDCFNCGIVCYSNEMKEQILGIKETTLSEFGAVSPQVAKQMAQNVRKISKSDVGISTTGIAGPTGGDSNKPVGLVYVGISTSNHTSVYKLLLSKGQPNERQKIRHISALFAMNEARKAILNNEKGVKTNDTSN